MKIRTGFVSNSSSSSFILAFDPQKIKLNRELCQQLIGEAEMPDGWLKGFAKELVSALWDTVKGANRFKTMDDAVDEFGDIEEVPDEIKDALNKGWHVVQGYIGDDEGSYEAVLCLDFEADIKEEHFTFFKEAGY